MCIGISRNTSFINLIGTRKWCPFATSSICACSFQFNASTFLCSYNIFTSRFQWRSKWTISFIILTISSVCKGGTENISGSTCTRKIVFCTKIWNSITWCTIVFRSTMTYGLYFIRTRIRLLYITDRIIYFTLVAIIPCALIVTSIEIPLASDIWFTWWLIKECWTIWKTSCFTNKRNFVTKINITICISFISALSTFFRARNKSSWIQLTLLDFI